MQELMRVISARVSELINLRGLRGTRELALAPIVFDRLGLAGVERLSYRGLFGISKIKPDGKFSRGSLLPNHDVVVEIKKATNSTEFVFGHGLVQCAMYAQQHLNSRSVHPAFFVCLVLDWGRRAGQRLDAEEKRFADSFVARSVFMVRVSLEPAYFVEHNLVGAGMWQFLPDPASAE